MYQDTSDLEPFLVHRSFVRRLAASLLRDPSDVDEVEQETWISALNGPREGVRDARSWLGAVVRNHANNLTRHSRRLRHREQASARVEALDPETVVLERLESSRVLVRKVMELSEPNRVAILLRYYEGHSVHSVATQLGVTTGVAKGRLQRGLAELRLSMTAKGEGSEANWRQDLAALALAPLPMKGLLATATPWLLVLGVTGMGALLLAWNRAPAPIEGQGGTSPLAPPAVNLASAGPDLSVLPGAYLLNVERPKVGRTSLVAPDLSSTSGEIVLRIGDGFVFGEGSVRPDGDRSKLDIYVQDIRHGISLATLVGGTVPSQPMTSLGLPAEPNLLLGLLQDAPLDFPKRDLWLLEECTAGRPGIGLAKSRQGQVYKLCLLELNGHPEALQRTVRIAYEPVPSLAGGGVLHLPESEGKPADHTLAALREALRIGSMIPGDSFSRGMNGDYTSIAELADRSVPQNGARVVLSKELQGHVQLNNSGALFAGDGIGPLGSVELRAYGAIGVQGPMLGHIDIHSYGYVYIDGPMEGSLLLKSYATLVLEQGLSGTLELRSYADVLIRGRITGTLDAKGSCWSTIYLDGVYTQTELIEISESGADMHQITLHVREADLPDGEHEDIGTWRNVIVSDPIWQSLVK